MRNIEVALAFSEIADLLEIKGENPFKVRAYRRASEVIQGLGEDVGVLLTQGKLLQLPGIGEALAGKVEEIAETGSCAYLEKLKQEIPQGVRRFLDIPGVGPRTAQLIHDRLGTETVEDLEKAARNRLIRKIKGLGIKTEMNILRGIELIRNRPARVPLGMALPLALGIVHRLRSASEVERVEIAGSLRRRRETIGDIDLVAASRVPEQVCEGFVRLPFVREVREQGPTRVRVLVSYDTPLDLRVVPPESFPASLQYLTGSAAHNVRIRGLARSRGLKINEYGVFRMEDDQAMPLSGEKDLYRILEMPWIPPELREDQGEIEAALAGALPSLLEPGDLNGDLHVHSDWSDGTAALEELITAARQKGYSYLAVCDHSRSLVIARGLGIERLVEQGMAIEELNRTLERSGTDFRLLRGTEVDILSDGSLDFPDEVLAGMEVVVASIHSGFSQDRDRITRRIISAMQNPHVDIIAHPTGRMLGRREAYEVDIDAVIEAAAATGTALEINSSPDRLDLCDRHVRAAAARGVSLAVDTDAHSAAALDDASYGVGVARRGWLPASQVLNALPLAELLERLRRKGQGVGAG